MTAVFAITQRVVGHPLLSNTLIESTLSFPTVPGPIGPPPSNDPLPPIDPDDEEGEDELPGDDPVTVHLKSTDVFMTRQGFPWHALETHLCFWHRAATGTPARREPRSTNRESADAKFTATICAALTEQTIAEALSSQPGAPLGVQAFARHSGSWKDGD